MFLRICVFVVFVCVAVAEWVEIPQISNRKSYIVTPYDPYIYEKSSVFDVTTQSSYETILEPSYFPEAKKSITKVPDSFMKLTTEVPADRKTTLKPPATKGKNRQKNRGNAKNRRNDKVTNATTTEANKVFVDEKKYDEEIEYEYVEADDDEYYDDEYYDDTEYVDDDDETDGRIKDDDQSGTQKGYSYASFIPYLQKIQSTLMRTSHKNVKSKVSFLTEIKDRLLYAIKQKIASIWAPADRSRTKRSNRGDVKYEDSHSDMHFPSNEGALLTIGFLTFAVFLIKCILKLIYAIKGKHKGNYYPKGMVVMPMMTVPEMRRRTGRSLSEQLEILNYIDEFKI